jgi:hypothetical protein
MIVLSSIASAIALGTALKVCVSTGTLTTRTPRYLPAL